MKLLPKLQVAEGLRIPNSFGYLTAHLNILFKTHLSALSKEKAQNIVHIAVSRCRNWRTLLTNLSPAPSSKCDGDDRHYSDCRSDSGLSASHQPARGHPGSED